MKFTAVVKIWEGREKRREGKKISTVTVTEL